MDTLTTQELEALRLALQNFINAAEQDSQITDEVYEKLKNLTESYEGLLRLNLGLNS